MSKRTRSQTSEERIDFIVGIVTVLAVIALFVWFFVGMSNKSAALGQIAFEGEEIRRGGEQTFICEVKSDKIKDGEKVVWSVNGKKVSETVYTAGTPLSLNYTPDKTGQTTVSVKVGKYRRSEFLNVMPPQLTFKAPDVVITYGDEIPDLHYDCCGFVDGDNTDLMSYDGVCAVAEYADCKNNGGKLNAGVYKIEFDKPCCYKDYEVNYVYGTLTVLPKELFANGFEKVYDGTNEVLNKELTLKGVLDGDEVYAKCNQLYFDDKNVGENKTVSLAGAELIGSDCRNYVLTKETYGTITPKAIKLEGLRVQNKIYDGTTKANVEKAGKLLGVLDGDSVAIGNVDVRFDEAFIGQRTVIMDRVTLIGLDKDNYILEEATAENAEITPY